MKPNFISRRNFAQLSVATGLFSILPSTHSKSNANGKLLIIGGAEDRINERVILKRFIELSGGNQAKLKFILAASSEPSSVWSSYSNVFKNLGATNVEPIALLSRKDAYNPDVVSNLLTADGIFMTGGDQSRLMAELWETPAFRAVNAGRNFPTLAGRIFPHPWEFWAVSPALKTGTPF